MFSWLVKLLYSTFYIEYRHSLDSIILGEAIIGEATGEATSSSEPSDRTASEYNLSEDIFSEIERKYRSNKF